MFEGLYESLNLVGKLYEEFDRKGGGTIATAESCSGGLLSAMLTEVPGSSRYFLGGVCCYSNASKSEVLGVPDALISDHGAVSEEVARALALGAKRVMKADFALSLTGIAGPGGGSAEKPVGTVWCGLATPSQVSATRLSLSGSRFEIRCQAVLRALAILQNAER